MNKFSLVSNILNECVEQMIGKADKKHITENDVDPNEFAMGLKVESEHSEDPSIRRKIALDHLAEIPDYYSRLKRMEDEAKQGG